MGGKERKNGIDALRKRAEEKISHLPAPEELSVDEAKRLVHELRVHEIELEMQNDALREAQAELIESHSQYTDLYDFAPVGYLTLDDKGIVVRANLTLSELLGVERSSLIGHRFAIRIAERERSRFMTNCEQTISTEEPQTLETRLIGTGGELPVLLKMVFVKNDRGKRQCRISVTDISERKKAEEAAALYMRKLERSNKELQEFAFIASHDLQEPLRKIQLFGSQLEKKERRNS